MDRRRYLPTSGAPSWLPGFSSRRILVAVALGLLTCIQGLAQTSQAA
jgi:hypothetical protein